MAIRITCISKDNGNHQNPHEAVSRYGWINEETNKTGRSDRQAMVDWMERERGQAYVKDGQGLVYCWVNTSQRGTKFLQTQADKRWTDNLLSLPECREGAL